jgi:hypothetical protein
MVYPSVKMLTLLGILTASCRPDDDLITKIEDRYELVGGKKVVAEQIVQSLRKSDNKPISRLTKIFNYDNDIKIKISTGLTKEEGLQDYLLDSIYYDSNGNDTLKVSFVHLDNEWQKVQLFRKAFRPDYEVEYFMTERLDRVSYKKEIFYKYSDTGRILSETEFECSQLANCDSVYKKTFLYDSNGDRDSTMYAWTDNQWTEIIKDDR